MYLLIIITYMEDKINNITLRCANGLANSMNGVMPGICALHGNLKLSGYSLAHLLLPLHVNDNNIMVEQFPLT